MYICICMYICIYMYVYIYIYIHISCMIYASPPMLKTSRQVGFYVVCVMRLCSEVVFAER